MSNNKTMLCLILTILLLLININVSAAEFSTDKLLAETRQKKNFEDNGQTCVSYNKKDNSEKQMPLLPIKDVQENPAGKITVAYRDFPVTISASKTINVIKVPYVIRSLGSSKFCPDDKTVSPNCINPTTIGKSEYQISVSPVADRDTDFVITTEEKTFLVTLKPLFDSSVFIEIKDEGSNIKNTANKTKAENFEKSFPYVEMLLEIIKKARRNEQIDGYSTKYTSSIHETPELVFILKKELIGSRYKVVYIDILNKTKNVIQLREDSNLLQSVVAAIAGEPLASNLSREFIQPRNVETERKGEHISTLISIVKRGE